MGGKVTNPNGTLAHDDLAPCLVVPMDKGTAEFSDIATIDNYGYGHKALGVTARRGLGMCKTTFSGAG